MKYILLTILLSVWSITGKSQKVTLQGRVTDAETGEMLSDVNIIDKKSNTGVSTNAYGLYSVEVNKGVCILQCSMLGYMTIVDTLDLHSNQTLNFALKPDAYLLQGVEISATKKHSGQLSLLQQDIQSFPMVGGEPDLIKTLQYLPGVVSGNDGANNISVRGNSQWGNLVLLDEAVVYNPNHALSFFSVFNNDAIQKVNLYKSYFPLKYGGRNSSIIDVRMREGNNKKRTISGTVGLISSKLMMEGPLKKGKTSYLISGRVAYPGAVVGVLEELSGTKMTFYDVNAKINSVLDEKNRIYFSIYNGGDYTLFNKLVRGYEMKWGNTTATFRWNRIIDEKLSANTSFVFSNYYYNYKSLPDGLKYLWKSNMQSYQVKSDWEYAKSNDLHIKGGASFNGFVTMPGSITHWGGMANVIPYKMEKRRLFDLSVYGEVSYKLRPDFQLNAGVRLTALCSPAMKPHYPAKVFVLPEPRVELIYNMKRDSRFYTSFTQASQSLHMLSNASIGLPSDMWVPANSKLKPSIMRQVTLGYEKSFQKQMYTLSLEGYYRKTNNIIDYIDNATIFLNNQIEEQVLKGTSRSYGVEVYLSKNRGALSGWISYTLSGSRNHIKGLEDEEYRPTYDRPHNLKVFLSYKPGRKWTLTSTFSYCSGMNLTLPIGQYYSQGIPFSIYTSRNGYRAPAFHQLDFSATKELKKGSLSFSFINVYNRKNVFSIYVGRDRNSTSKPVINKMYLYGVVPSISYNFKF